MSKIKKKTLFDDKGDDDEAATLRINDDYASKYDNWRKLEEKQKLLARHGEVAVTKSDRKRLQREGEEDDSGESDSDSTSDDDADYDTPEVDKDFLRALSALKSKDPRIYDENVTFAALQDEDEDGEGTGRKKKKEKPMYLRDYDRHIILEKGGRYSEDEDESDTEQEQKHPPVNENDRTYFKEQQELKESLKKLVADSDEEEEDGLLKVRAKTKAEKEQEDADYRKWLKEAKRDDIVLEDENLAKDLSGLRKIWAEDSLPEDEKFLKDYLLNQRYKEQDDEDFPTYDEIVEDEADLSEDEEMVEKQEEFEHKYNFRFEEPDPDFIKSYPRTLKEIVRKKDTRRRDQREEKKARKEREKEEKRQELERLKELKREEIMERLSKIKEVSGNDRLALDDKDLEEDFDPEEYDRRMADLYGDDYYGGDDDGVDGEGKPLFPYDAEIDGDMPDWDNWDPSQEGPDEDAAAEDAEESRGKKNKKKKKKANVEAQNSQDDESNFVMDCDYDPDSEAHQAATSSSKKKGKKRKKSVFAKALQRQKPVFDPVEKQFEEYFDEYYQLDFEDLVGDLPTRFKYRKVVANDFGLTTDEILTAKDKDLNRWVPLKKALQYRREEDERYDVHAYKKRAENMQLKKKLLPSVYDPASDDEQPSGGSKKKRKKKKKKKGQQNGELVGKAEEISAAGKEEAEPGLFRFPVQSGSSAKQSNKRRFSETERAAELPTSVEGGGEGGGKNKKKFKQQQNASKDAQDDEARKQSKDQAGPKISDERLKAFGLNPKKIRNIWKYGGKQKTDT